MIYHDVQRMSLYSISVLVLTFVVPLAIWWIRIPSAQRSGIYIVFAVLAVIITSFYFMFQMKLDVNDKAIEIHVGPFGGETIQIDDIAVVSVTTYRPLRDFGGWGIRRGLGGKIYSVSGNSAVKITLKSNKIIYIGTNKPDGLLNSIVSRRLH